MARKIAEIRKDKQIIQKDLLAYEKKGNQNINMIRFAVRQQILRGETIQSRDQLRMLLKKEYELEREEDEVTIAAEMIVDGKDPKTASFRHELNRRMIELDLESFKKEDLNAYRKEIHERVVLGDSISKVDVAGKLLQREFEEERGLKQISIEAALLSQGYEKDSPLLKKTVELQMLQSDIQELNQEKLKKQKKDFLDKINSGSEIDLSNQYFKILQKEKQLTTELDALIPKEDQKKKAPDSGMTPEEEKREKKRQEQEKKRQHAYSVEFAGKELLPEIRGCGDPKKLQQYRKEAIGLPPLAREHLESRIYANLKIMSYEKSRAIKNKNRPPAVKYKDGTILLKNKRRDVPKQTSANGCWSAVLSDMLNHFGTDLSQEEIRAYRPELNAGASPASVDSLMERLNADVMNEINDVADLIQRTVPNVAHHHMSLGVNNKDNKALLKETVKDALLNKNSPVAVLYGDHYLSIVGIKGNTLIVQDPSSNYNSKYQKLSINDLFDGCKEQVTIDWLEDLKFAKNGTCKNVTEQWKKMGVNCDKREFKAGGEANYMTHVKGNEYYDTSRILEGVEETIYLPKMSFGREKDIEKVEIMEQKLKNVKEGILSFEELKKQDLVIDDPELDQASELA